MKRRIVIVGGGLAGMAAAMRVLDAGDEPVVVESRDYLGGRATSFHDPRSGEVLDNCQHVVMGCCTNVLDFYERLGVGELIEWHESTYWANPPHQPDVMRPGPLPAPGHFTFSFMRMRFISLSSKRAIARAMLKMMRIGLSGRARWTDRTFLEFLEETRQPAEAIDRFWRVVVVSACNLDLHEVGASFAMQVFQEGFLSHRFASSMGLARVPLGALYDPFVEYLEREGGTLQSGTSALSIAYDGHRVTGVVTKHGLIEGAAVITAVPPERLARLCSDTLVSADQRLQALDQLEVSPILGVHLFFDTPVMTLPHLVLPGRDTHWLFNKGTDDQGRQHVHAVISAAEDWMSLGQAEIRDRVLADLVWALPGAAGLEPVGHRAIKENRATFRAAPGVDRIRPSVTAGLGVENLLLAGDWCDTGWPATMEGAVRSGYAAGAAACGGPAEVADLPIALGGRLLGLR